MKPETAAILNRKASYEYHFLQTFDAGIILTGTEVKSIRQGKANLSDSYCIVENGEVWAKNIHISEYEQGSYNNHEPKRQRKLLLNKSELRKIQSRLKEKGTTIIPTKIFFNERGFAKIQIALARGKKQYDKREDQKRKEAKREIEKMIR